MLKHVVKKILPARFVFRAVHFRKQYLWGGFGKDSYSENGEDKVLVGELFPNKIDGFYVDVGALHPKDISNTYLLYMRGWSGINIEPNPESIKLLNKFRPRDTNINVGISRNTESLPYYAFSHAGCNTFSKKIRDQKTKKPWITYIGQRNISCLPLKEVLKKHMPRNTKLDLLDIDVEGMDYEVLESNDWEIYRPSVVLVEDREYDIEKKEETKISRYMRDLGYELHTFLGLTSIWKDSK